MIDTLDFADVRAASDAEPAGPSVEARLGDGTLLTVTQLGRADAEDATTWFRISASGETETAAELGATVDRFDFSLSRSDAEIFSWSLDDLSEETAS